MSATWLEFVRTMLRSACYRDIRHRGHFTLGALIMLKHRRTRPVRALIALGLGCTALSAIVGTARAELSETTSPATSADDAVQSGLGGEYGGIEETTSVIRALQLHHLSTSAEVVVYLEDSQGLSHDEATIVAKLQRFGGYLEGALREFSPDFAWLEVSSDAPLIEVGIARSAG